MVDKEGGFMAKNRKEAKIIGSCPQGKGFVTSHNSEKSQRCVRESFPKGEIMERRPLPQDTKEYFDLRLMEDELKKARARVSTKNMRIGG
jgi:hypothetical protein